MVLPSEVKEMPLVEVFQNLQIFQSPELGAIEQKLLYGPINLCIHQNRNVAIKSPPNNGKEYIVDLAACKLMYDKYAPNSSVIF